MSRGEGRGSIDEGDGCTLKAVGARLIGCLGRGVRGRGICESVVVVHKRLTILTLPQIDVLRRMNYRGANASKINDDKVVEELLKS